MEFKDYYAALGVEPTADLKTIKTAYRRLARKFHPDVSQEANAESQFKAVAEAYEVLKDEEKRAEYDDLRKYGRNGRFETPPGWRPSGGGGGGQQPNDFSDFFESVFGGQRRAGPRQSAARRGQDVELEVQVALEDTMTDHPRTLSYQLSGGRSMTPVDKTLKVKIPAGVSDGDRIRVKGQGPAGSGGGAHGDLWLVIRIAPHPVFDIDGDNLIVTLPLAPWEAALGGKVRVPTLSGSISLTVPANSQTGRQLRIKGKGRATKQGFGDLYVVMKVVMPAQSDPTMQQLWQQLADHSDFQPRAQWEPPTEKE